MSSVDLSNMTFLVFGIQALNNTSGRITPVISPVPANVTYQGPEAMAQWAQMRADEFAQSMRAYKITHDLVVFCPQGPAEL